MSALVSIIIPAHNAGRWISETLSSAIRQTWADKEIIVVDDGSTDDTLAIARSFEPCGVIALTQPNAGASAARNRGLRTARGSYLQLLDADDILTPDKLEAQITRLFHAGSDSIATCRWGRFVSDPSTAAFVDDEVFRDFQPVDYLLEHTGRGRMMHPAAWLVPRAVAERAGTWDESLSLNDDGEWFSRVVLASRRIIFSPQGASLYRSALPASLSGRRDQRALGSLARSVTLISSHLLRAEDSPRVRRALADYWQRLVFELYPDAPDLCAQAEARVREFGGSNLRPPAGKRERRAASVLGWKLARRLRCFLRP